MTGLKFESWSRIRIVLQRQTLETSFENPHARSWIYRTLRPSNNYCPEFSREMIHTFHSYLFRVKANPHLKIFDFFLPHIIIFEPLTELKNLRNASEFNRLQLSPSDRSSFFLFRISFGVTAPSRDGSDAHKATKCIIRSLPSTPHPRSCQWFWPEAMVAVGGVSRRKLIGRCHFLASANSKCLASTQQLQPA